MWYAIVDASSIGLELEAENAADIVRLGEMIKVGSCFPADLLSPVLGVVRSLAGLALLRHFCFERPKQA